MNTTEIGSIPTEKLIERFENLDALLEQYANADILNTIGAEPIKQEYEVIEAELERRGVFE